VREDREAASCSGGVLRSRGSLRCPDSQCLTFWNARREWPQIVRTLLSKPWSAGLVCLVLVVFFHSPRWWIIAHTSPGTFEWDRAITYLKQCEDPFREDVEPAMHWRFVPQVIVWAFGGNRAVALAIPWLGAWALLVYIYRLCRRNQIAPGTSIYLTLLLGASAPVLASTGWLGVNDAWVALGLCCLAFDRRKLLLALACLLGPFIDERFVFGVPLALLIRNLGDAKAAPIRVLPRLAGQCALAVVPFMVGRILGVLFGRSTGGDFAFLAQSVRGSTSYLWMTPLGVAMAFRFGYLPVTVWGGRLCSTVRPSMTALIAIAVVPVIVGLLLASDSMRTAGILLPLCLYGAIELAKQSENDWWPWLALANLLFAAAHISYTKIMPINSLPIELWRLIR